jgi:1,4-dihydroxy-2-naphthoate octaprenyltransferase
MTTEVLGDLARHARPLHIFLIALGYVLGVSVARYLGIRLSVPVFWLGFGGLALAQTSMGLLAHVFGSRRGQRSPIADRRVEATVRSAALLLAIGCLAVSAVIAYALFRDSRLSLPTLVCLSCSLLLVIAYAVPPMQLVDRGFGEPALAVHIGYVGPSIGFLLQAGRYHSLLNTLILPSTLLLVAMLISYGFASYARDLGDGRTSLVTRLGWERALWMHHGALLLAYALIIGAILSGFAPSVLAPAFLSLPFAILQVLLLRGIGLGARPLWTVLRTNGVAVFGLTAYFLILGLWLR